jgi:hypothetical protein
MIDEGNKINGMYVITFFSVRAHWTGNFYQRKKVQLRICYVPLESSSHVILHEKKDGLIHFRVFLRGKYSHRPHIVNTDK